MTRTPLHASVRIPDDVIFRDLEGEAIILNLTSGVYYGLNEVGSRIWSALATSANLGGVVDVVQSEFDVERSVLEHDVTELVEQLAERGLIVVSTGDAA